MGFSLQMFFDEMFTIMTGNHAPLTKYMKLTRCIHAAAKYAAECGQIKGVK